jgi:hypothetical protein
MTETRGIVDYILKSIENRPGFIEKIFFCQKLIEITYVGKKQNLSFV